MADAGNAILPASVQQAAKLVGEASALVDKATSYLGGFSASDLASFAATAWSKKNTYDMLQREIVYAQGFLNSFKRLYGRLYGLHDRYEMDICTLGPARAYISDFESLLSNYNPSKLNTSQKLLWPEWYREQLHYYLTYGSSLILVLQGEINDAKEIIAEIAAAPTPAARSAKQALLRGTFRCK
jgi:hypothetical protein